MDLCIVSWARLHTLQGWCAVKNLLLDILFELLEGALEFFNIAVIIFFCTVAFKVVKWALTW